MIKYECDMCGVVLSKADTQIIECFPRRINTYVRDTLGVKLTAFVEYGFAETHLCPSCCNKISNLLPVVESD